MCNTISLGHIEVDPWKYSVFIHAFIPGKKRKRCISKTIDCCSLSYMCNTIAPVHIDVDSWPLSVGYLYCFHSCYCGSKKKN